MTTQYDIKTTHCLCIDITGLKMPPSKRRDSKCVLISYWLMIFVSPGVHAPLCTSYKLKIKTCMLNYKTLNFLRKSENLKNKSHTWSDRGNNQIRIL